MLLKTRLLSPSRLLPVLAALAACLGSVAVQAAPAAPGVTVGDPKNPDALAAAVQAAYAHGARRIVIRPGSYVLPDVGHTALTLDGWKDAVLSAYGVTLILTDLKWTHDGFDLHRCTRVTLQGATLSQNQITSYQGRVVALGKDADGKATCDFRPDAGYPVPPADPKGFLGGDVNIVDAHTRRLKVGNGDFYGVPGEALGGGTFRVHFHQDTLNFGVGDWLVGRYGNAPFKVYLDGSRNCTIQDVTLLRNGFAPIREDGGGGNHYRHCVWKLGPRPAGATEEPLVTNAADGMHMIGSFPGPDIENCVFEGVFLDDCIAIHGGFQTVKSALGQTLTLDGGPGSLQVGQPVRLSNDKGFFGEAVVTALQDNGDKTTTVTLDRDLNVPQGVKLSNPRADGAGYKIIGCRLGGTRSRGILVKSDNGIIKDNVIEGCGQAAISVGPEYYWNEADYAQNVLIEGNTLRGNGLAGYGGGAILIHGDGARGNKNITLKDNRLVSNDLGDVDAQWTEGLTLTGNVLVGPAARPPGIPPPSAVALANCQTVTLRGNRVQNPSAYKPVLVSTGGGVSDVTGNDPSGIHAVPAAKNGAVAGAAYRHDGSPADTNLHFVGRWDRSDAGVCRSHWGGAYLHARFTGTSVALQGSSTAGGPALLVSLDGEPPRTVSALDLHSLTPGVHALVLGAPDQNSEVEFRGLTLDPGGRTLPVPVKPILEFVGDSITTGGGKDAGTVNYAWQGADLLGADHVQIAFSARALTSGFGCVDDKTGLDVQYFRLKNFNHLTDTPPVLWDFSYTPQMIVINLGQNDQCGGEPAGTLTASYVRFVRALRARLPKAQIVVLQPFHAVYAQAERAAASTLAASDARVHYVDTNGWLAETDFLDGVHPTPAGHAKAARRLANALRPLLAD